MIYKTWLLKLTFITFKKYNPRSSRRPFFFTARPLRTLARDVNIDEIRFPINFTNLSRTFNFSSPLPNKPWI